MVIFFRQVVRVGPYAASNEYLVNLLCPVDGDELVAAGLGDLLREQRHAVRLKGKGYYSIFCLKAKSYNSIFFKP